MRLIISGGGTGGHIYPAVALYNRLQVSIPDCDTLYIGSKYGQEHSFMENTSISYEEISVKKFDKNNCKTWFTSIISFLKSLREMRRIIKKFKPDLVISMGGFVSIPVILVSYFSRVDTMIHEQNSVPSASTKFLSKYADRVLISYKESLPYFKKMQNKLYYTGNPVRQEFLTTDRSASRKKLNVKEDELLIISMAGSNGSEKFNELSIIMDGLVKEDEKIKYIHIIGKGSIDNFKELADGHIYNERTKLIKYSDDTPSLMSAADLMICRAGALTLAEMAILGLPGIIIPEPEDISEHQTENARSYAKEGSCVMIEENNLTDRVFVDTVKDLIYTKDRLINMGKVHGADYRENALSTIVSLVYDYQLR